MDKQPENIKKLFELPDLEINKLVNTITEIDGKVFIVSKNLNEKAFALVRENESDVYKMVFFRESGSDRQWKSLVGYRKDGNYKKGEERNPRHHYVQSAKLHPKLLEILEGAELVNFQLRDYIPQDEVRFSEEDTYKENYYEFKNPNLSEEFDLLNKLYKLYQNLWEVSDKSGHSRLGISIFKTIDMLVKFSNNPETSIKIESILSNNPEVRKFIDECKIYELSSKLKSLSPENQTLVKQLINTMYQELIFPLTERILKNSSNSFEPDFSIPPIKAYVKGDISIEEFGVTTPEGDNLIYAMAYDKLGRVYIDNIYDKNSGITPYGTYSNLINSGMLVWKPEDYSQQTAHIPEEYKYEGPYFDSYDDIADIFSLVPVIKNYREHLKSRGVYVRELKSKKS